MTEYLVIDPTTMETTTVEAPNSKQAARKGITTPGTYWVVPARNLTVFVAEEPAVVVPPLKIQESKAATARRTAVPA